MVKNTFLVISSDPEVVFKLFIVKTLELCFPLRPIFDEDCMNMCFHGNQKEIL